MYYYKAAPSKAAAAVAIPPSTSRPAKQPDNSYFFGRAGKTSDAIEQVTKYIFSCPPLKILIPFKLRIPCRICGVAQLCTLSTRHSHRFVEGR